MDRITETLQGLPGGKNAPRFDEDWRYTDLRGAIDVAERWMQDGANVAPATELDEQIKAITQSLSANWIVIQNGLVDEALLGANASYDSQVRARPDAQAKHPTQRLGQALQKSQLHIDFHAASELPLGLLFIDGGSDSASVASTDIQIDVAPGCDVEIIEYHASFTPEGNRGDHFANSELSVHLGEASTTKWVRLQKRAAHHFHCSLTSAVLRAGASLNLSGFDLGGGVIRNDLNVVLAERDANAEFSGLYLVGDGQHIDNHTCVDHAAGPAMSSQEYRGILSGNGRGVWNGKAIVREGADGTDANQANHNLLLSDRAEINTKPELEIYADDVKCSHGTTVGQLDDMALYYLRTRGIGRIQARQMLTHAFAVDLVSRIAIPSCSDVVQELVATQLSALVQEIDR